MNEMIKLDWDGDWIDEHRRGISDLKWAGMQPDEQNYMQGDIVEFMVGGVGFINEVSPAHNGWPVSYSANKIDGKPFHATSKCAWHYDGDIKRLIVGSSLRSDKLYQANK